MPIPCRQDRYGYEKRSQTDTAVLPIILPRLQCRSFEYPHSIMGSLKGKSFLKDKYQNEDSTSPPGYSKHKEDDVGEGTCHATPAAEGHHDDEDSLGGHVEEKPAAVAKMSKRKKLKRHCGRFWLWYLGALIVLLAILLPVL